MKLSEFIESYKGAITQKVVESYPPQYQPSENYMEWPALWRKPMGGQADAIQGAILSLKTHPGTIVVGEMGVGKTTVAVMASHMSGFKRVIILCPPHLVKKWKREIEETIPYVHAVIVNSITDLERLRKVSIAMGPLYVVMSREKAKLSYRWRAAYCEAWLTGKNGIIRDDETDEPILVPRCPSCWTIIVDKDGVPLSFKELNRKKHNCMKCFGPLWQADNKGHRRFPLADYISRYMKNFFELFIGDEVHEYKGHGSAQGIAAATIANACKKSMTLTGTLMGGYSSTLFHLLYRFSPEIHSEFLESDEGRWITRYGFQEKQVKWSGGGESDEDGRSSKRRNYRTHYKEIPGLAPPALFHLIGNSIFLRLSDVATGLPPYDEQIILSPLERATDSTGWSQHSAYWEIYKEMRQALVAALMKGSKRLLSTYLQCLLAYPDGCTRGEVVVDPDDGMPIVAIPPLDSDVVYPKERTLAELIEEEKQAGRKVLVYVTHTGTRDITGRMKEFLEEQGYRTAVLKADMMAPDKREAWINERVAQGIDVLVCHPRLVQTGLDLVDFPTIVWFETDYSVYTMRQASRRSWRIGQTRPVKVVFMGYTNTIQIEALKLIARKLQSSLAVEGELPEEGLSSFGDDGEDMILALARQIVGEDKAEETDVSEIFLQSRSMESEDEEFIVDATWHDLPVAPEPVLNGNGNGNGHKHDEIPETELVIEPEPEPEREIEPEPEPEPEPEEVQVMGWEQFLTDGPANKPKPAGQSLFEWAMS